MRLCEDCDGRHVAIISHFVQLFQLAGRHRVRRPSLPILLSGLEAIALRVGLNHWLGLQDRTWAACNRSAAQRRLRSELWGHLFFQVQILYAHTSHTVVICDTSHEESLAHSCPRTKTSEGGREGGTHLWICVLN